MERKLKSGSIKQFFSAKKAKTTTDNENCGHEKKTTTDYYAQFLNKYERTVTGPSQIERSSLMSEDSKGRKSSFSSISFDNSDNPVSSTARPSEEKDCKCNNPACNENMKKIEKMQLIIGQLSSTIIDLREALNENAQKRKTRENIAEACLVSDKFIFNVARKQTLFLSNCTIFILG